jgi:hypothetical protein
MKRVRLGSTAIATVTYDEEMRSLDVEFRGGDTYRYFNVFEVNLSRAVESGIGWCALE